MTISPPVETTRQTSLRLWPGVIAALLLVAIRFVIPLFVPGFGGGAIIGAVAVALAIIIWWLFFSRAPWSERIGAIAAMGIAVLATYPVAHHSITNGLMGRMVPILTIPLLCLALVVAVVAARGRSALTRRLAIVAAFVVACASVALVRTAGVTGDANLELHWRWTPTPEEQLLAQTGDEPVAPRPTPAPPPVQATDAPSGAPSASTPSSDTTAEKREPTAAGKPAEPAPSTSAGASDRAATPGAAERALPAVAETRAAWPGFRGPNRDSVIYGVQIETGWAQTPPVEVWRRPIGPGWSSFAVRGDLVYTQEQRGEHEIVSAYSLATGEPVWRHRDAVRFYESNGGPGPRGTPTVHNGRVYTMGATGIVNALSADTGARVWSRNAMTDSGATLPGWGFASSPLVVEDLVIVAASDRLVAYDAHTGKLRWLGPTDGGGGYSSPHLVTLRGVPQIVLLKGGGAASVAPADGKALWSHTWIEGTSILQPALFADGDLLIAGGDMMGGTGIRRVAVTKGDTGWTVEERWTSRALKPYFNDFVVHGGHAFGFDASIMACIDLETGERKWKGGRYGHGQLVLLPDQDLLLVLSEEGDVALVSAKPDKFTEVARFKALEGKTWNHPVLTGNLLLVRNGEEMAAFRLLLAEAAATQARSDRAGLR
jgi:outer membrane protein assembly factor BamB